MEDYLIFNKINEIKARGGLTDEEIDDYFLSLEEEKLKGVPLEDIEARAILILAFKELIYYSIKMLGYDIQDETLYQEGLLGLINAIDRYSRGNNNKFITYATVCIKNSLYSYKRHISRRKYNDFSIVSLEENIAFSDGVSYADVLSDDQDFVEDYSNMDCDKYLVKQILANFRFLRPIEQYCFVMGKGLFDNEKLTQRDLAKILNCTHSSVSLYQIQAKQKLRLLVSPTESLTSQELADRQTLLKKEYPILDFSKPIAVESIALKDK